jgi:hypothetical protein
VQKPFRLPHPPAQKVWWRSGAICWRQHLRFGLMDKKHEESEVACFCCLCSEQHDAISPAVNTVKGQRYGLPNIRDSHNDGYQPYYGPLARYCASLSPTHLSPSSSGHHPSVSCSPKAPTPLLQRRCPSPSSYQSAHIILTW